jgi:methionyl-tRNA formyltransferase
MPTAVVFAYHNVGNRCLAVLLAQGFDVALVVTHEDAPSENIWFDSVRTLCERASIRVVAPSDPNTKELIGRVRDLAPELIFSFYYRNMLSPAMLATATRGAYNMHGSLLPKYRGRAPVNWAIIHGESETGATLHEMVAKPDAGRIVDQQAVPILPNDIARDVFDKVTVASELVLARSLPALLAGTARLRAQDLTAGSYYGGRKPEDGRLVWSRDAWSLHNLVRAVAPPYPGAFAGLDGRRLMVLRTWWRDEYSNTHGQPMLFIDGARIRLRAYDGGLLDVLEATLDGAPLTPLSFLSMLGSTSVLLQ